VVGRSYRPAHHHLPTNAWLEPVTYVTQFLILQLQNMCQPFQTELFLRSVLKLLREPEDFLSIAVSITVSREIKHAATPLCEPSQREVKQVHLSRPGAIVLQVSAALGRRVHGTVLQRFRTPTSPRTVAKYKSAHMHSSSGMLVCCIAESFCRSLLPDGPVDGRHILCLN
jgi:hypothetical protein